MNNIPPLIARYIVASITCALVLIGFFGTSARADANGKKIARMDQKATPTERAQYPKEMIVKDNSAFDGSYTNKIGYRSTDRKFTVALWESGPGVLKTDAYPHDEYCLVIEGHLIVTNRNGSRAEFAPGDAFVIPKGWAGTWNTTGGVR